MGNRPVTPRAESAPNLLMGTRETEEISKAVAKFLRKLESAQKNKARAENKVKLAR